MQRFTATIVNMIKQENLYASQGGPVILSQIENEYGNVESFYGPEAKSYISWASSMATSLETGVPWVMCQQADAPDPIINTCNGFYCDQFTPNSDNKPKIWTENWSGWFLLFGGRVPYRPVEDLAFAVARFFQRGGTFQNYYMYHGGTNFGHTSGGPFIATSYDYDAPIDEYGMIRQPKWGHLKDLHKSIKLCEEALVATDPTYSSLGPNLEAHVYKTANGQCAAFLANVDIQSDADATFNGKTYHLPAWSVSILPDCQNVVFNTAQINSQATTVEAFYLNPNNLASYQPTDASNAFQSDWKFVNEPVGISKSNAFGKTGLLEQINTTADSSDYLWYSISTQVSGNEPFINSMMQSNLHIESLGHVLHVFVNGNYSGNMKGTQITFDESIFLTPGSNRIDLLSATVGLQNYGAFFDLIGAGITGPVQLRGQNGTLDLSSQEWTYQIGLKGEELGLHAGFEDSNWVSTSNLPKNQPLVWYMTSFGAPEGNDPVAIDFTGMGKGEAWINGQSIGRYWPTNSAPQNGCTQCNYRGSYDSEKCQKDCGKPSQQLNHVPRSMIQKENNTLVLFEEMGGDPTRISFAIKQVRGICGHISELHPSRLLESQLSSTTATIVNPAPVLKLECPYPNQVISSINFASFGTPSGNCGSFTHGQCSSSRSLDVVKQACIGSKNCSISVSIETFGDPCKELIKSLAVEAACS
ncbi:Beta-galactosidase 8 [Apostasia shenzhenica]|uniref:Beta-galactosidase n=1 Tax=Apostasia shenzhenica TaxID=1088818 RepID=A0A2I0AHR6_9ASPA|nr:Beta-galactosidase 8 [Apostasia shenzhenica]